MIAKLGILSENSKKKDKKADANIKQHVYAYMRILHNNQRCLYLLLQT